MNKIFTASLVVVAALMLPIAGHAADADRSSPTTYAKDSVITTKIKTLLAEEKLSSLVNINVDTDNKGAVTLTGTAGSQKAVDKAVSIARGVTGVASVDNRIKIVADK